MNVPVTISLLASVAGVAAGVLALRVSRVKGWRELRWFAVIAFLSSAYAISNLSATGNRPALILVMAHVQLTVAVLQHWAWMRYAQAFSRTGGSRWARRLEVLVLAAAAMSSVPGASFERRVTYHAFPTWNVVYGDVPMTPLGFGAMALLPLVAGVVFVRFARARREGIPYATLQAAAYGAVVAFSVNDALVSTGRFELPYLLDLGFVLPVGLIAWATSLRFVEAAQDLEVLRGRLESLVDERTRALAETQQALVRAERLASLGRLADGVAHQVSNPASVVTANLRYLAESLPEDAEVREVLADSTHAMQRINQLVRRLADAGRIASAVHVPIAVDLGTVVGRLLAEGRLRVPGNVTVNASVPVGVMVRTRPETLEQVLQALLTNAIDAVPLQRGGRIEVRAERLATGVRVTVEDDGVGMRPEVLERAFEPFFTTKPAGQGNGLGLSVSRGIVEVHGGSLWLESTADSGTTAVLVLPEVKGAV